LLSMASTMAREWSANHNGDNARVLASVRRVLGSK
jgi:hypothetical protein